MLFVNPQFTFESEALLTCTAVNWSWIAVHPIQVEVQANLRRILGVRTVLAFVILQFHVDGLDMPLEVDLELRLVGTLVAVELYSLGMLDVEVVVEKILEPEAFPADRA